MSGNGTEGYCGNRPGPNVEQVQLGSLKPTTENATATLHASAYTTSIALGVISQTGRSGHDGMKISGFLVGN